MTSRSVNDWKEIKPCVTCTYYRKASWFSVRRATCANERCNEKAWDFLDKVTGEVHHHPERNQECYLARLNPCGPEGLFWKDGDSHISRARKLALIRAGWSSDEIPNPAP